MTQMKSLIDNITDITVSDIHANNYSNKRKELTFNSTIVDIKEIITKKEFDDYHISISSNKTFDSILHGEDNYTHDVKIITCDNLHKHYRHNNINEESKLALTENLTFYYRSKLSLIFDSINYTFNKEVNNVNILTHIIPHDHDIKYETFKLILEVKSSNDRFRHIQLHRPPFYASFNYETGYLSINQPDIQVTNKLKFDINSDSLYLSFIRYEGDFGASISPINNVNLNNWLDASFNNIDVSNLITIYNNYNFNDLCDNNVLTKSQIKELAENNFFFFFQSKPWPPIYLDGSYLIPYNYYYGTSNESIINNFDNSKNNLKLKWKIPNRRGIKWNYNINENIYYVPEYDNLSIDYRDNSNNIWNNLLSINMIDPSINSGDISFSYINSYSYSSGISNINNKYQDNFTFIFDLSRNISVNYNTINIDITSDNSFIINFTAGSTTIVNGLYYQFRVYLKNSSTFDISLTPDYRINQYNDIDPSWNYLYYPDISSEYFITIARGDPKSPTNLIFIPTYESVIINGSINNIFADTNNIITIPTSLTGNNRLGFILDLSASQNSNYKKAIPFNQPYYYIDDISNLSQLSTDGSFSITITPDIQPEYTYDLSNYGMFFKDNLNNISYANNFTHIDTSFITPHPLRNEVNNNFNNTINNINIFNSDSLAFYNSDISYILVSWRSGADKSFNFFTDASSLVNITYSSNINLYNSINDSSINQIDEPRGIDLSGENLSSFQLLTYKNSILDNSSTIIQTTGTFNETDISIIDNSFTLNLKTMDITGITDYYTKTNGYYIGTTITDISYAIDLNNFFDIIDDLDNSNIIFKPQITQTFPTTIYDNSAEYLIYKITDDLTQEFIVESSSITIQLDISTENLGTYFGITSIRPTSAYNIEASFNADISGLSKYIRPNNINSIGNVILEISAINITGSQDTPSDRIDFSNNTKNDYTWPDYPNINMNLQFDLSINPYENFLNDNSGNILDDISFQALYDLTLYNNLFTSNHTSYQNIKSNIIDLTANYFWDTTRVPALQYDPHMIRFINNPLANDNTTNFIYDDFFDSSLIYYNQILFQNNNLYGADYSNIYQDYRIYQENSNINYNLFDNSGDILPSIYSQFSQWFYDTNEIIIPSNNIYKWICFKYTNLPTLTSGNIKLDLVDTTITDLQSFDYLFFIKIKYTNLNFDYSMWLNCQRRQTSSGYNSAITQGIGCYTNQVAQQYPLKLIIPFYNNIQELYLLIGIKNNINLKIDSNFINLEFNAEFN